MIQERLSQILEDLNRSGRQQGGENKGRGGVAIKNVALGQLAARPRPQPLLPTASTTIAKPPSFWTLYRKKEVLLCTTPPDDVMYKFLHAARNLPKKDRE
jgi:hypothetical protein